MSKGIRWQAQYLGILFSLSLFFTGAVAAGAADTPDMEDPSPDTADSAAASTSPQLPPGVATAGMNPQMASGTTPAPQIPITDGGPQLKQFDQIMQTIMGNYNVPGGALAIAKDGKLVLARGYGYADLQNGRLFSPTTLFSMASVTKAVTGVAALRLVDEGRLNLDDTLYNILGKPKLGNVQDPRVMTITVRQLLHHSAGWKTDFVGYDQPTYNSLTRNGPIPFETLLLFVMANKPLDYAPGAECHYSNFQFGALKSVIEHASGQNFETYVNEHVMQPMGVRDNRLEPERGIYLPNEAHRYSPVLRPLPGGHPNGQVTGSLGSWESSVVDMCKFLTAVDGTRTKPFLSKASFDQMVAPVPAPVAVRENGSTFGLGWDSVKTTPDGILFEKNGGVPGVHTYIEHLPNNVDWVVIFNGTGVDQKPKVMGAALRSLHQALSDVKDWPQIDLFQRYQ
ncbi:MAG: beta-lactamase family protein [Cyanobacteria bacterium SZAS-4]|nr:beta-lactamase family protein [Cyanobacteria bacterium SZAS-4]